MTHPRAPSSLIALGARRHAALSLLGLMFALQGCGASDRMRVSSIPEDDYRVRHPILLSEAGQSMDIFPVATAHGLDQVSAEQVREFAKSYKSLGQGPITILVPTGGRVGSAEGRVEAVRRLIASVAGPAPVMVGSYPIGNPALAAPIRLSYVGLKARVADQCGQWPRDLASGSSIDGWDNKPYWNYGCSMQTAIAAQVADPRDLVTPRAEAPADTVMRSRGIETVRKGTDPATDWKVKNTSISGVGGS